MGNMKLPADWGMEKLISLVKLQNGYAFKSNEFITDDIPIIRINNLEENKVRLDMEVCYPKEFLEKNPQYKVENGDILISMSGSIGKISKYKLNTEALLNQRVGKFLIDDNKKIDKNFLFYFLRNDEFQRAVVKDANGCVVSNISAKSIGEVAIQVPPLETQKKIVGILEKAEKALEKRKESIKLLDELVKSKFIEMFGDPVNNTMGWEIKTLSDISTSRLGKMLDSKKQTGKYLYPYLANFNVQWFRFELKKLNEMDFDEKEQKEFELRKGDLLVCEGGEIGRAAVWNEEISDCYFQKALHRVRCNQKMINPYYLAWVFYYRAQATKFREVIGSQATIAHLTGEKLKQLQIIVPPIALQNQFTDFINQVDKLKFEMQKSLEEMENNFNSLMQRAFKGELFI